MIEPPAQSQKKRVNILEQMKAHKEIKRLRVLPITNRVSSWNYDAKNLCRIYTRMVDANLYPPRLMPLMSRWAELLLEYGEAFDLVNKGAVLDGTAKWQTHSIWMINLIRTIQENDSVEKIFGDNFEFGVKTFWKNRPPREMAYCSILHNQPQFLFTYYISTQDQYLETKPIGGATIKYLRRRIQTGLNNHRSQKVRQELKIEIRRKMVSNHKQRGHRDRLFSA